MKKLIAYLWFALLVGVVLAGCFKWSDFTVSKVYDGDSIVLSNGDEIRLIGIDAPERDEPGYEESKAFLDKLIQGSKIRLEKDKEDKDRYNRLLRYAYLPAVRSQAGVGETFVNAEMVKNGYAIAKFYKPNDRYQAEFTALEKTAQESKKGLWATGGVIQAPKVSETPKGDIITWKDAGKHIGQIKTVEGKIVRTFNSGKACFLNFDPDYKKGYFEVVIFPEDYAKFSEAPEKLYQDKEIRVRGRIKEYQNKPEIIVRDPGQMEIVENSVSGKVKESQDVKEVIVYVTKTGNRYHREGCESLRETKIAITLEKARKNYLPCKVCDPPK